MKNKLSFILMLCVLFSTVNAYALPDYGEDEPTPSPIGINLCDMRAEDMAGEIATGDMFTQYELTVIVVWVIWSGASDSAMEAAEACKVEFASQNINTIGIYYEDEMHPVGFGRRYYEEKGYTIYSLTNRNSEKLDELFHNTEAYLPVMYVIGRTGEVLDYTSGYMGTVGLKRFVYKYKDNMNTVRFISGVDNSVIYETYVRDGDRTYYPNAPQYDNYLFRCWDKTVLNITEDMIVTAYYDLYGDANLDGRLNTGDATLVLRYAVGMTDFSDHVYKLADINHSGNVNTGDVITLLKMLTAQ